ncbi:MAG: hypothetical protein M1817_005091 [Caeruleum heppii]|nr:MAG: hypothetical protein M1817_005091 [Caeruleum heppii]
MESKRKASAAASASVEADDRANKRRKLPTETAASTQQDGLRLLELIKLTKDKRGRAVATDFHALPDRTQFPDYYDLITTPLSIDIIEAKLTSNGYKSMSALEFDLKQMVTNAKSYNHKDSAVFSDAERIRKVVSNYMSKFNPSDRSSAPTIPVSPSPARKISRGDTMATQDKEVEGTPAPEKTTRAGTRGASASASREKSISVEKAAPPPSTRKRSASKQSVTEHGSNTTQPAGSRTFQEEQELIMQELINLQDEDGLVISEPFLNLPSRAMRDYYRIIKHPISLKQIEKKVKGVHGRNDPTGITDFQSWKAFEDQVSFIWRNAREYNEDGSDISTLADKYEAFFKKRLADAKSAVSEPAQPSNDGGNTKRLKLKINQPAPPEPSGPKITLHVNEKGQKSAGADDTSAKDGPQLKDSHRPSVAVDDVALQRQAEHVQASLDGRGTSAINGAVHRSRPSLGAGRTASGGNVDSAVATAAPNPVKSESGTGHSPLLGTANAAEETQTGEVVEDATAPGSTIAVSAMPPPSAPLARPPSDSPHPQQNVISAAQLQSHTGQHPASAVDSKWRPQGKGVEDALLSNLAVSTHPGLNCVRHFHLNVPPDPAMSQQSITISLSPTHYYLRIVPTIGTATDGRATKLLVTANNIRVNPVPLPAHMADERRPLYETRLNAGVNRIEVEMVAGPMRGAPKIGHGQDFELEKITIFANLMRC